MKLETNITEQMKEDYRDLIDGDGSGYCLVSCFMNGLPTAAIASVWKEGDNTFILPLFVAVTDDMAITNHDGEQTEIHDV